MHNLNLTRVIYIYMLTELVIVYLVHQCLIHHSLTISKSLLTGIIKTGGQVTFPLTIYVLLIPESGHLHTVFCNILVFRQYAASIRHSRVFSRLIKING